MLACACTAAAAVTVAMIRMIWIDSCITLSPPSSGHRTTEGYPGPKFQHTYRYALLLMDVPAASSY